MLNDTEIERFVADGFVAVRSAVPPAWPGANVSCLTSYGPGRQVERRGVGGSVPVRFPSTVDPGDAGWHIDGSIPMGDTWGVTVNSQGRGLLCLFLFSDVGRNDAPAEIKRGSHLLLPPSLEQLGPEGGLFNLYTTDVTEDVLGLPSDFVTGKAGDVFLCHPFLVHRATWPHSGTAPRFMAQPEIGIHQPFPLTGEGEVFPVEQAILMGLGRQTSTEDSKGTG